MARVQALRPGHAGQRSRRGAGEVPGNRWLVLAGYSLAFACVLITGGRLGDI